MRNNYSAQRELVYEVLSGTVTHPTADWVYGECRKRMPNISKGTVYRNLAMLVSTGRAIEVSGNFDSVRYDARVTLHNHMVCTVCGAVEDSFPSEELTDAVKAEMEKCGYTSYGLTFYGKCSRCKAQENEKTIIYKQYMEDNKMAKFVCTVCGYVHEGDSAPAQCPVCKATTFKKMEEGKGYACEHEVGVARDVDKRIMDDLVANFNGECSEVGMYLAMSRQADREGYPEIAEAFKRYALEEAEHAAKFAELIGDVLTNSTAKNLKMRMDAEAGACEGKLATAKLAKELGYDAVHDTVHEMAKDEARHGAGFTGLYNRYFGK